MRNIWGENTPWEIEPMSPEKGPFRKKNRLPSNIFPWEEVIFVSRDVFFVDLEGLIWRPVMDGCKTPRSHTNFGALLCTLYIQVCDLQKVRRKKVPINNLPLGFKVSS